MKDKKSLIGLLVGILLGVTIMGVVVCFAVSKVKVVDKTYAAKVNNANSNEEIDTKKVPVYEYYESKVVGSTPTEEIKSSNQSSDAKKTDGAKQNKGQQESPSETVVNKVTKVQLEVNEDAEEVIDYIENTENKIFTDENIKNLTSSVKTEIIKITDFVFNGTEINGHTFDELTEEAKLYVMDMLVKIDSKIEEVHPGYKDEIKLKVKDFTEKVTNNYYEITEKICTNLGSDACLQAKKDVEVMKENFGLTIDLAKVIGKSTMESIKNWYEIFKSTN